MYMLVFKTVPWWCLGYRAWEGETWSEVSTGVYVCRLFPVQVINNHLILIFVPLCRVFTTRTQNRYSLDAERER